MLFTLTQSMPAARDNKPNVCFIELRGTKFGFDPGWSCSCGIVFTILLSLCVSKCLGKSWLFVVNATSPSPSYFTAVRLSRIRFASRARCLRSASGMFSNISLQRKEPPLPVFSSIVMPQVQSVADLITISTAWAQLMLVAS